MKNMNPQDCLSSSSHKRLDPRPYGIMLLRYCSVNQLNIGQAMCTLILIHNEIIVNS